MLTTFCLRLACGMIGCLLLLKSNEVNPRFYRTQYLVALGLIGIAAIGFFSMAEFPVADANSVVLVVGRRVALPSALIFCCIGSIVWSIEGNPGHGIVGVASALTIATTLVMQAMWPGQGDRPLDWLTALVGNFAAAALLGCAVTSMLLGHFYLIAPGMSIAPLLRLLTALFVAAGLRMTLAAWGLRSWSVNHSLINWEDETVLWLPVRWALGFGGPIILGWMARSAAKIRSTQSATGILYVVVVLTFLGELTSQILTAHTGYWL